MTDVFIGFLYDEAMEAQLLATSKSGVSSASNQYQKGFLSGLSQPVQILTTSTASSSGSSAPVCTAAFPPL